MLNNPMPIESILPAGDYATDHRCGFSQLSEEQQNDRDLLKVLTNEYMRYLFDPDAERENAEASNQRRQDKPHEIEALCTEKTTTVTDYILGDRLTIDLILGELPVDEWNEKVFFGEGHRDLIRELSPLSTPLKNSDSILHTELSLLRGTGIDSCL